MVDLSSRLKEIKSMIDDEKYFTINRARQYGKTTILSALADYLDDGYEVVSLDFQTMSSLSFESEQLFVAAFSEELLDLAGELPADIYDIFFHCTPHYIHDQYKDWSGSEPQY